MAENEISGVIPVYKPKGWTSFDVVAKIRRIMHTKKVGHGGTLDPMAEGVLPVFVGRAAKACDLLPDRQKGYDAGFVLGITTDTQDITGEVLKRSELLVSEEELKDAAEKFVGTVMQIPPMYSAVKIDGKKLYELAREGKTVERMPRPVNVKILKITDYDECSREGHMTILCEKGTYVRTLINDIGDMLGCGGAMTSLKRTYSGGIDISECKRIEEIERDVMTDGAESVVRDIDKCFMVYPPLFFDENTTRLYKNGVKLRPEQAGGADRNDELIYRVYGFKGEFIGLGKMVGEEFRSVRNFFVD